MVALSALAICLMLVQTNAKEKYPCPDGWTYRLY